MPAVCFVDSTGTKCRKLIIAAATKYSQNIYSSTYIFFNPFVTIFMLKYSNFVSINFNHDEEFNKIIFFYIKPVFGTN